MNFDDDVRCMMDDVDKSLCSGKAKSSCQAEESVRGSLPTWTSLQKFSFGRWASSLCRQVLATKTPFAEFLRSTFHISRSSSRAPESALFPLPVPKTGVFEGVNNAGTGQRKRKAFDQVLHIVVMAMNFWHADFKFPSLDLVARVPSRGQVLIIEKMRRIVKAFGSCDGSFQFLPVAEDVPL